MKDTDGLLRLSALTSLYTTTSSDPTEETQLPLPASHRSEQPTASDSQGALHQEDDTNLTEVLVKESNKLTGVTWPSMTLVDFAC